MGKKLFISQVKNETDFIWIFVTKIYLYVLATWCPPCQRIKPIYKELASHYPTINLIQADVDELPEQASTFRLSSIPSFFFMNGEKVLSSLVGADSKKLEENIKSLQASN